LRGQIEELTQQIEKKASENKILKSELKKYQHQEVSILLPELNLLLACCL
jgi:hypothetical protein